MVNTTRLTINYADRFPEQKIDPTAKSRIELATKFAKGISTDPEIMPLLVDILDYLIRISYTQDDSPSNRQKAYEVFEAVVLATNDINPKYPDYSRLVSSHLLSTAFAYRIFKQLTGNTLSDHIINVIQGERIARKSFFHFFKGEENNHRAVTEMLLENARIILINDAVFLFSDSTNNNCNVKNRKVNNNEEFQNSRGKDIICVDFTQLWLKMERMNYSAGTIIHEFSGIFADEGLTTSFSDINDGYADRFPFNKYNNKYYQYPKEDLGKQLAEIAVELPKKEMVFIEMLSIGHSNGLTIYNQDGEYFLIKCFDPNATLITRNMRVDMNEMNCLGLADLDIDEYYEKQDTGIFRMHECPYISDIEEIKEEKKEEKEEKEEENRSSKTTIIRNYEPFAKTRIAEDISNSLNFGDKNGVRDGFKALRRFLTKDKFTIKQILFRTDNQIKLWSNLTLQTMCMPDTYDILELFFNEIIDLYRDKLISFDDVTMMLCYEEDVADHSFMETLVQWGDQTVYLMYREVISKLYYTIQTTIKNQSRIAMALYPSIIQLDEEQISKMPCNLIYFHLTIVMMRTTLDRGLNETSFDFICKLSLLLFRGEIRVDKPTYDMIVAIVNHPADTAIWKKSIKILIETKDKDGNHIIQRLLQEPNPDLITLYLLQLFKFRDQIINFFVALNTNGALATLLSDETPRPLILILLRELLKYLSSFKQELDNFTGYQIFNVNKNGECVLDQVMLAEKEGPTQFIANEYIKYINETTVLSEYTKKKILGHYYQQ